MALKSALMLALFAHVAVFSFVTISFSALPRRSYRPEFLFWGGIVRKEELAPAQSRSWHFFDGSAVALPNSDSAYYLLWGKKVAVDKEDVTRPRELTGAQEPLKFSGPRVTVNMDEKNGHVPEGAQVGFPSLPKIRLRYPK
ncbi:MAG: hypothetical protein HGA80_02205 [Candidatus Omnitrophica bacterium]|nr:hypothetical protein [Candidatus Omnitrophota bacterium]